MKSGLPNGHGLADRIAVNSALLPRDGQSPSVTDIQYAALDAGVARGTSMLVSAPTSTGKTLIGWWAVSGALAAGRRVVYLVSFRALAHQKFEEAQRLFLDSELAGDRSAIVCATGDSVEDASGRKTSSPLTSRILVATYEKFLGCLSTGGPPRDLSDTLFICDEVQLIGDPNRGQSVELLLTLLKRSSWYQFVGLSAVLSDQDGAALAHWLGLALVRNPNREKMLAIECRSPSHIVSVVSSPNREPVWQERPRNGETYAPPSALVAEMAADPARRPVIVFCMKVDDTVDLAKEAASARAPTRDVQIPAGVDFDRNLADFMSKGVAYHNAELSEAERLFVEQRLADGAIDVVFATSTLAAGVNFPLGSAVFGGWKRWNFDRRRHEAISRAEFQNMAGRVGRMGQQSDQGYVLLSASGAEDLRLAATRMDAADQEALGSGIAPEHFGPLVLQILAGKLCHSREQAFDLLASTLSAAREIERNANGVNHWRLRVDQQIDRLIAQGCVIDAAGWLTVTALGEAVARSGLKPETAIYFIDGLARLSPALTGLLPHLGAGTSTENDLAFVLAHASLASPEFTLTGGVATRRIPWRVSVPNLVTNPYAQRLGDILFFQPWMGNVGAANGALLLAEWAAGASRQTIEQRVDGVRMGSVESMARDAAWVLTGIAEIIFTVTAPALADEVRPPALRDPGARSTVRQLARTIRRQAARVSAGLPGDILWITSLDLPERPRRLSRNHILSLRLAGLIRSIDIMDGSPEADNKRRSALDAISNPTLANRVRDAARRWKAEDRDYAKRIHQRRAEVVGGSEVVEALYTSRNHAFESAFEALLGYLSIPFQRLDGPGRIGHPDFLVQIEDFPGLVVELKSKLADHDLVSFNDATDVLRASEIIGMREHPCVTLCNPGVEPSVPGLVEGCGRLCVVEVCDLAEAAIRLREGTLSRAEFYNWLTTPGIAVREDLPHGR